MSYDKQVKIPVMRDLATLNRKPDYLLWIGCAGSFDERYKKVIISFIRILNLAEVDFAVLGEEESCTGDPARRAGNEFLFQMQALANIQLLNNYGIKKIITACPHCYNTIKNEYPAFGGIYEVIHHTQLLERLIKKGQIKIKELPNKRKRKITYHDSCYLGRSNNIYDTPRIILKELQEELVEMERHKADGLCCGAGGSQMFKESEKGNQDINIERTGEALLTKANTIATACPFCLTMMSDGIKDANREKDVSVVDIVELIEEAISRGSASG